MTDSQLSATWAATMRELEVSTSPTMFKTWFKSARLLSIQGHTAELGVENEFAKNSIRKFSEEKLVAHLSREAGFPITVVQYTVLGPQARGAKAPAQQSTNLFADPAPAAPAASVPLSNPGERGQFTSNLNPKYTFETFIVGNRNRLAYAAARAVAERPGTAYNPLYLYGGVGLGKTHLMQAVGNEIVAREPQKRILYVSCESFTNEYVSAVQRGKMEDLKKKYRGIDCFLVDDIQFMAGKDGTQEEFFHTFNALYQTNKQIIITSDKIPSDIKDLEERLSSRFAAGLIADMQLPDLETRQAILLAKCLERGIRLPDEVVLYIADRVETNIRELEGALMTVFLKIEAGEVAPTSDGARAALSSFSSAAKPLKKTSLENITSIVCEFYGVELDELKGPRRMADLVKPRQVLMYLMKHELGMTFLRIGQQLGGRDHTTAMHSVEKIEKTMKKDPELLEELKRIKELFYAIAR